MPSNNKVQSALELIKKDPSKVLGLTIGGHEIKEPGQYVPRADAKSAPTLTHHSPSSDGYLVIALDLDAPFPSLPLLSPLLHWAQPLGPQLAPDGPFIADYIGPGPPPGSAPHRYAFFLYERPAGLEATRFAPAGGKPMGIAARMRAGLDAWEGKLGLGEVVAVNYFRSN